MTSSTPSVIRSKLSVLGCLCSSSAGKLVDLLRYHGHGIVDLEANPEEQKRHRGKRSAKGGVVFHRIRAKNSAELVLGLEHRQ